MRSLINFCIDNNRATIIAFLIIILFGYTSYVNMPRESAPDIQIPFVFVSTNLQGVSPLDGERLLVKPMEDVLKSIEGVKEIKSFSLEGRAYISLEFPAEYNINTALYDVRSKSEDMRSALPSEASIPHISEFNIGSTPILNIGLLGDLPERTLMTIAKNLRDRIESLPNILSVDIAGLRKEKVYIYIKPNTLQRYNLNINLILAAVSSNNKIIAAGHFESNTGKYAVNISGVLSDIEDVMKIPLGSNNGSIIHLRDVAEVKSSFENASGFARMNGMPCIVLEVSKRSGKNIIDTTSQVRGIIDASKDLLPQNLSIVYSRDESNRIKDMLSDLENNILFAVILVFVMMVIFMGLRTSLLVSIAIPGSFLIGILILEYLGVTLNMVVLFSLILSVGMLVDAAIVVCEYADRKMIVGYSPKEAFKQASFHMLGPIFTSTLTTLVVFLPLLFWPGLVGQFMKFMPLTLLATLTGSFIMAIIFIPLFGSIWGKASSSEDRDIKIMQAISSGDVQNLGGMMKGYSFMLSKVLKHPKKFVFSIGLILVGAIFSYSVLGKGVEFFPKVEPDNAEILVRSNNGNMSVKEKDLLLKEVENKILDFDDEVQVFYARSGAFGKSNNSPDDTIGKIQLEFIKWNKRRKASIIMDDINDKVKDIKGVSIEISGEKKGPSQGNPINISLLSYDKEALNKSSGLIVKGLEKASGIINIDDGNTVPALEWVVEVDKDRASLFDIDIVSLGNFIKLNTNGVVLSKYRPDYTNDEIDIVLKFADGYRSITDLEKLFIPHKNDLIPISSIVKKELKPRSSKIVRIDGFNSRTITADVEEGILVDDKIKFMEKWLEDNKIDDNVYLKLKGEAEDQKETGDFLKKAFITALLAMMLILTFQFNSLYSTFVIMTSVFLCIAGVLIGLLITDRSFGIVMCGVGLIALSGIVVNNNILLIDAYKENLKEGLNKFDAIYIASLVRVRPIMLTAGTTVLGLLPMVTCMGVNFFDREVFYDAPSSQWWVQLSTTIASGLTFATVLTLLFTPCLLIIAGDKIKDNKEGPSSNSIE